MVRKANIEKAGNQPWIIIVFVVLSLLILFPLLYVVSVSLSSDGDIARYGYLLIPKNISFQAYDYIFRTPKELLQSYMITIIVTTGGTILALLLTSSIAYVMTRKDYRYSRLTTFFVFFTLLFNAGLVPSYIVATNVLHIQDTIWALILPYGVSAWFTMLMKGFMDGLPFEIIESAKIDGSGEWGIFARIILPLSKPALATVGLFYALAYWNDWWLAMLYIQDEKLVPLQYYLQRIMTNIEFLTKNMQAGINVDMSAIPTESARMAIAILAAGPMLFAFPFFQKYLIKGMTVGSIKG
ncbi:carbohydrate ABC transporter permease [Paenibacillus sp. GCM10012307]|uniref:Carbohydrate ABC transporter permease n=1 Tax=Paenibacillus roseus TaxID=2798579 RepID=A0A934J6X3_9BACL|nr:carbohydrate ABC transporter permease [Paenibacillus roseus]MBJ6361408.1 carbohydrate ABC transporter permease [Paenibacillus roseus]